VGRYTQHWLEYRQQSTRRTLQLLGILLLLPVLALVTYGLSLATAWATPIQIVLLVAWLALLVRVALRASKVACPRCATVYSRGRGLCDCPACGLRMLQED
jgi:hypothetical protein